MSLTFVFLNYILTNMGNIHTSGPNEALVVSGGCFGGSESPKIKGEGGWAWAWWFVTGKCMV